MNEEIEEEYNVGGNKDYIISILEEMNDDELDDFDIRFRLIDKREILTHIIHTMDERDEVEAEKLSSIYSYVRDAYWSETTL